MYIHCSYIHCNHSFSDCVRAIKTCNSSNIFHPRNVTVGMHCINDLNRTLLKEWKMGVALKRIDQNKKK